MHPSFTKFCHRKYFSPFNIHIKSECGTAEKGPRITTKPTNIELIFLFTSTSYAFPFFSSLHSFVLYICHARKSMHICILLFIYLQGKTKKTHTQNVFILADTDPIPFRADNSSPCQWKQCGVYTQCLVYQQGSAALDCTFKHAQLI